MTLDQTSCPARRRLPRVLSALLLLGWGAGAALASPPSVRDFGEIGLTERVVVDRTSGVAMRGYDPVSYFVAGTPRAGLGAFEAIWNGAAWRFANEGNLAAFKADPDVYAPAFGGYDPTAVARGVATPGDPRIFAFVGNRLYFFHDVESRAAFVSAPTQAAAALGAWPALEKTLIR